LLLVVMDQSEAFTADDERLLAATNGQPRLVVGTKRDLPTVAAVPADVTVSAATGAGLDTLRAAIVSTLAGGEPLRDTVAISNTRHIALLEQARTALDAGRQAAARGDTPEEFVLADLQTARARLDEIVGVRTSEDVLRHIFERFCVGK
jgi:tRNA modification GTPase